MRVYCSDEAILYYAHMKKNLESIKDDGILISLNESTIVVHDHLKLNYNDAFDFINSECGIHLIRRLTKMEEITEHECPQAMISLMLAVKNAKDTHASYDLIDVYDDYDEILELGYSVNKHDLRNPMKEKEKTKLNDLRAYKEAYLLFASFDDCDIFVKSRRSAERVKESVSRWLEDKLFLKVNMEKTKVVRPVKIVFPGFSFYYAPWRKQWSCRPSNDAKKRLKDSIRAVPVRKRAIAQPMDKVFLTLNQKIQGWINYYSIGYMKTFMTEVGKWLRHKVRVLYLKIWKRPKTICRNLTKLNHFFECGFSAERIRITANSRLGLWKSSNGDVVNFCISPNFINTNNHNRRGLADPLHYYLSTNRVL